MSTEASLPQVTILIENPRKSTNWGPLLRCCSAFGISQIFCIGFEQCSVQGSHGASKHVQITAFHTHEAAQQMLKDELGFRILGLLQGAPGTYHEGAVRSMERIFNGDQVEQLVQVTSKEVGKVISDPGSSTDLSSLPSISRPLHQHPFWKRTCLAVGKKSRGLPRSLASLCDGFTHIPHHGPVTDSEHSTAGWLTTEAGLSIALHEFAMWAGYGCSSATGKVVHYQGQKYHVEKKIRGGADEQQRKQKERKAERERRISMGDDFATVAFDAECNDAGDY